MSVLKKLAGEAALYGISSILGRMLNYLLVPFYTALFVPSEYGVITNLYAYVAFFNVVYTFGMETTYFRFAARHPDKAQDYYEKAFTIVSLISLSVSAWLIWWSAPLSKVIHCEDCSFYISALAITMAADGLSAIPFARLRLEKNAKKFVTVRMASIFLNVAFNILFLYFGKKMASGHWGSGLETLGHWLYRPEIGVGYVFLSNMLANLLALVLLRRELILANFNIDLEAFKRMFQYGYPIMLMGLAGMVSEMLGRLTLEYWLPEGFYKGHSTQAALGIYGACYKLSIFMQLAIQAFKYAAEPFFFSQASDKNAPTLFADVMKWFIVACMLIFVVINLNINWIAPIFLRQPAYLEGINVVPVLLLANMFLGVYYNLTTWFKLSDKTHYGSILSIGGAAATVLLNFLLIPLAGYMGSAVATMLCYGGMAVVCYWLGQKYYPIPYDLRAALFHIGLGVLIVGMSWETRQWPLGMHIFASLVLFLLFLGSIALTERNSLNAILARVRRMK
ncbi:Membrane protein involved in the export of O-antigen and teichoic acid [Flexibacter flexilis DSM 6793]|uniref:Membrane protein involved in the export of O-antigen and teichoic acid n=1 Tax=Flexibacter flexilis DSM 6793 TaxID=927664 RepID=A0A1I1MDY7_9BACT|nr:polysaccharide biosynthesis C-terminal domain-containing protein [Flexibacter flexilis]SFC83614.1 Membrane protein involved in the export of O-antigen and teichoic acid [Flexibacter flexilis DSM 6793]